VVGVNAFTKGEKVPIEVFTIDVDVEKRQGERLAALRSRRNAEAAASALDRVERAARSDENLMPPILEAVEAYATLGEISDRLRNVFGEYRSS
jgi:methylmalonyl-CoA mutase N-terminal domain/subunit